MTLATCPASDLKNAVGRTMEYVIPSSFINSSSNLSFAFWNVKSGFCNARVGLGVINPRVPKP